jgi:hypothetical protein
MKTKLIFLLSIFGLVMAFATVYVIPSNIEPLFWLIIFIVCAFIIAKKCSDYYFLHGFLVSIVNCVWITAAHIIFFQTYLSNHQHEAVAMAKMPLPDSPRLMMALTGPIIGILSGLILGWFAVIASKFIKD